jgi:hypothetical protein
MSLEKCSLLLAEKIQVKICALKEPACIPLGCALEDSMTYARSNHFHYSCYYDGAQSVPFVWWSGPCIWSLGQDTCKM